MGKCSNCKKKIEYNKFKMYRGKILCYNCYATRLERKKAKALAAEQNLENMNADDEAKKYGYNTGLATTEEPTENLTDPEDTE